MLSIKDFKPITLKDKPVFDEIYKKYPPEHSDYVFTTLVSWMDYADYHYTIYKKNLLIYSKIDKQIRFRPPIGKYNKEVFDELLKITKNYDSDCPFGMIPEKTKKWMEKEYPSLVFLPHKGYFDYVYLSKDLAELSGSKYSKIRNRLNKFKRTFSYSIEKIDDSNIKNIKKFLKRWCLWKDCESDKILKNEKKAIHFSMDHFFDLKLSGICIIVNKAIEAIAVYEKMNDDIAVVHYEKGSPDYDGIYKAINQETAEILKKDFKYINRESDMGIPGLRKAKKSYRPDHMLNVYHIDKKSIKI